MSCRCHRSPTDSYDEAKYETQGPDDIDPAKILCRLLIPNQEVRSAYLGLVQQWFAGRLENRKLQMMLQALVKGKVKEFERYLRDLVANIFSYHDFGGEAEKVYQAFVIGLLVWLGGQYEIKSNGESGYGRYDVMLIPKDQRAAGIIIEFKKINAQRRETKDRAIARAFAQIEEKKYANELLARGVQEIRKLAIVFKGKQVWVKEV